MKKSFIIILNIILIAILLILTACSTSTESMKPAEAKFEVTNLNISKHEVGIGEPIIVTADIANIGESDGTYTAILKIDDTGAEVKEITLAMGKKQTVEFTLIEATPGTYNISIGEQAGTISVVASLETFVNPTYGYSFSHPKGWLLNTSSIPGPSFDYQDIASIGVVILQNRGQGIGTEDDLETVLPVWLEIMQDYFPQYEELSRAKIIHDSLPAYGIEFS